MSWTLPVRSAFTVSGVPLNGNIDDVEAGRLVEQMAHQLGRIGAGAVVELARLRLRSGDQFLDRDGSACCGDRQHGYGLCRQRDRDEVAERVIGQVLYRYWFITSVEIDRHEQRVAVGRRLRRGLGADNGVATRTVLDHHRLPPILAHPLADETRDDVARSAGGEGHDHSDRSIGKARRLGLRRRPRPRPACARTTGTKNRIAGVIAPSRRSHLLVHCSNSHRCALRWQPTSTAPIQNAAAMR